MQAPNISPRAEREQRGAPVRPVDDAKAQWVVGLGGSKRLAIFSDVPEAGESPAEVRFSIGWFALEGSAVLD